MLGHCLRQLAWAVSCTELLRRVSELLTVISLGSVGINKKGGGAPVGDTAAWILQSSLCRVTEEFLVSKLVDAVLANLAPVT